MLDLHMNAFSDNEPPILICADLQVEYLTEGRSHVISDAEAIMSRCLELMTLWRDRLWPVVHLKRIAQAAWFNPASNLTNWIAELRPQPGELAFEHPLPSAYSSARFAEYMANMRSIRCLVLGFSLDETRAIRDPRGMLGRRLGVDMHVVTADVAAARNLMLAVERCHLAIGAMVAMVSAPWLTGSISTVLAPWRWICTR